MGSAVQDAPTDGAMTDPGPDASPEDKARYQDALAAARKAEGLDPDTAEATGDQQPDGPGAAAGAKAPPEELRIRGTIQLAMTEGMGGKRPTHAVLTIGGLNALELHEGTTIENGTFLRGEFVARVEEAGDKHKMDRKQGIAVDCVRKLKAHAYDIRIHGAVESPVLEESDAAADLKRAVDALRGMGMDDAGIRSVGGISVK